MRKLLALAVTAVACAFIGYMLWEPGSPETEMEEEHDHHHDFIQISEAQLRSSGVEQREAAAGELQNVVRAPAQITICANTHAHILPKVSGIALTARKNLGEQVFAGEILATLESREVAEAKAAYLTSLKREQLTANTFHREKTLYEKKITPAQEYHLAENAWEEALIDVELSRQKLHALGLDEREISSIPYADPQQLGVYSLRSPLSGVIIARDIMPGEFIDNFHEIYTVANLEKVWAEINLFSQDRPLVNQGQTVNIATHSGQSAQASVVYLSPIIDPDTRTSLAIAEIDNSSMVWLPGTFAEAKLMQAAEPVSLMIPKEAIQNIEGVDAVFVANNEGFAVRPVIVGRSDELSCEILSGLSLGERYASKNTFLLKAELLKDEAEHMD